MSQAKTRQQIANEYQIDRKTLMRWLENKKINLPSGLISPRNVELIYNTFGWPKN